MAQTSIITGQYVCIRQTAATVMQRFFAWVLDFIILCIFYYFAVLGSYLMVISLNQFDSSETIAIMMEVVILLLPLLYPLLMEIYTDGKTIGDIYGITGKPANATCIMGVDRKKFIDLMIDYIRYYSEEH